MVCCDYLEKLYSKKEKQTIVQQSIIHTPGTVLATKAECPEVNLVIEISAYSFYLKNFPTRSFIDARLDHKEEVELFTAILV